MTPSQSQPAPSTDSIEQLIAKLGDKFDLTGKEIADVLWLTLELQKFEAEKQCKPDNPGKNKSTEKSDIPSNTTDKSKNSTLSNPTQINSPTVYSRENKASVSSASSSGESQGLKIGIPDPPSLREPLTFAYALRPLMRRVATGRKLILNEAATVKRIAEERIFVPVLQAEPEPWLDLALVIDESHSMLIWGHIIRELKEMFKKYGIFRDIRVWGLQPDETGEKLQFFSRMGSNKRLTEPKEIIDPTGRRLILIVSDCVSNIWRKGMIFPVLKDWTQKQPLAILQMLPEWMWRRTALDLGTAVGFKSSIMGAANQELSLHKPLRRSRSIGLKVEERSKIPVITLDREKANQWCQMLIGKADAVVPGYLLPQSLKNEEEIEDSPSQREQNTTTLDTNEADERVHHFRMTASPLGRELAGLLAASPVIVLPVVRLIQESLLPKSSQIQVAEVFLGGLLRPKPASLEKLANKTDLNPDLVEYEFIKPEIRNIFLDDAPVSDSVDVVNAVSRYVAEQLGVSLSEFMAILKAPQKVDEKQREDTIKPFAEITAKVLRKLGGEYVEFAEELESNISKTTLWHTAKSNFYALLIGIDYYPNSSYQNLQGAVRDIDKVGDYLEKSLKISTEQITRLTSPLPNTNSLADVRSARVEMLPTYQNIVDAFKQITETASAGDLVYIHYSGYGIQVKTIFPDLKGEGQYDESLVLMDVGNNNSYHLRDVEFTRLIQNMLQKGLVVTIIMDCDHSGGLIETSLLSGNYVFLGACGPSEYTYEEMFDGKESNGALTYWMIDTLNSVPGGLTYRVLYDHLKGKIQNKFRSQSPMLLGESDRLVFRDQIKPVQYSLIKTNVDSGKVTLDGGMAQGLSRGTQFALYSVGSDFTDKQKRLAVVEVTEIEASTCTAKILSVEESGVAAVIEQIEPGLPAVMESAPEYLKHRVRTAKILSVEESGVGAVIEKIEPGLPAVMESAPEYLKHRVRLHLKEVGDKEYQLPQELVDKQAAALEKVRQKMQGNGWLTEVQGNEEEAHYQVAIAREGEYEISRGTPIKNLHPALSIDDAESPAEVVKRLVHLAKYQTTQDLDNPASELTNAIEYELLDAEKQHFPDPNNISLKSGDRAYVRLKNIDSQPLNVAILNFQPIWWKISQSPIQGDKGAYFSLQPGQETLTRLSFRVPDGNQQSEETLKLFVTRGIANFQWLILPPLNRQKEEEVDKENYQSVRASLKKEDVLRDGKVVPINEQGVTRGENPKPNPNPLSKSLSTIGADPDNPPELTGVSYDPDPSAEWLTKSISVTVKQ